jgi:hypothetical protein
LIIADLANDPLPQAFQPSFALQSCGIVRNRNGSGEDFFAKNFFSRGTKCLCSETLPTISGGNHHLISANEF